jgi:AbiV family abortive infection protein
VNKKLDAYKGTLTPAQLAAGINAARQNAQRLAADAATLLAAQRFPSALALAILSIEEAGKIPILRRHAVEPHDLQAWKDYRSHTRKNVLWPFPSLVLGGARALDEFRELFSPEAEEPYILDQLKQIAFYTDCLGNAHWSIPDELIHEPLARSIVETARIMAGRPAMTTEEEIGLWIAHLGPAFASRDPDLMKHALLNWHEAMQAKGLTTDDSNNFKAFVTGAMTGATADKPDALSS